MVAVGATMVGSYHIFGEEGQKWLKGKVHGEFRFGGSTVLLLFEVRGAFNVALYVYALVRLAWCIH